MGGWVGGRRPTLCFLLEGRELVEVGGKKTRGLEGIDDIVADGPGEPVAIKGAGVGRWVGG